MKTTRLMLGLLLALGAAPPQEGYIGPVSPEESLKYIQVPDGFRVELVAAEPDVRDPVALSFDENGRMYVCEYADYPLPPPRGRIRLLEDTDGDGKVDRSTLFAKDVSSPKGVLPWKGGILVAAAPDVLYLKDTDGDGKADVRETVFTGFREGNQQHRANTPVFGIDNWIYLANGDSGGDIRRPGEDRKVSIRGSDIRFRPDFSRIERIAGQSQYANAFDDWGNRFINNNSHHLRHAVLPLRYVGRNPDLRVPSVFLDIPDHGAAGAIFPISKLQERPNDKYAANHFTSACGVSFYRAELFPEAYRGNAFVCEPVHNMMHRDVLERRGATFVAKRGEKKSEFFASRDNWCRPVKSTVGPDGALYVLDMYRAVIEHPQWIPLEMQKRWNLRAGEDRGRIYRILPKQAKGGSRPKLGSASGEELVAALNHGNAWWRTTAQRLLFERQDKTVEGRVRALAREASRAVGRLHALWTLEGLGVLREEDVLKALEDRSAGIREHALRLAEPLLKESEALRKAALARAGDGDARVRFQAAFTLGEIPGKESFRALASILVKDVADPWTRTAALTSLRGAGPGIMAELKKGSPEFLKRPAAFDLIRQLADLTGATRKKGQVVAWLKLALEGAGKEPDRWRLVALSALGPSLRRARLDLNALLKEMNFDVRVNGWLASLMRSAADAKLPVAERTGAIGLLALLPRTENAERLSKLLSPKEPMEVQVAVVRALVSWPGNPLGARLLDGWLSYTGPVRREVLRSLFARSSQMERVLDGLEKGVIRVVELESQHRDRLIRHRNKKIRDRARKLFEARSDDEFEELIQELSGKVLKLKGDQTRGEKMYMTHCSPCHRLHGQGHPVGPNLASVSGRDKKVLLSDILNPNRGIDPRYQQYIVKTPTEEMVAGVIASETPTSITLRRALGEENTILRRDILEIKAWPASMMPEGLENNLSNQDFADLLEFLRRGPVR